MDKLLKNFQIIWAFTLVDYRTPSYNKGQYIYPEWCHALGWMVTSLSLAALPAVAILEISKTRQGTSLWEVNRQIIRLHKKFLLIYPLLRNSSTLGNPRSTTAPAAGLNWMNPKG